MVGHGEQRVSPAASSMVNFCRSGSVLLLSVYKMDRPSSDNYRHHIQLTGEVSCLLGGQKPFRSFTISGDWV